MSGFCAHHKTNNGKMDNGLLSAYALIGQQAIQSAAVKTRRFVIR